MNEKDNYLHTAELSEEQNDNMLDGILNNLPPSPLPKWPEKKELDKLKEPMAETGIINARVYMRKMALNGYILHVDLTPARELVSLQRRCTNNLNQVAVHANTLGLYPEEIAGLQRDYEKLWGRVSDVLMELSALVEK